MLATLTAFDSPVGYLRRVVCQSRFTLTYDQYDVTDLSPASFANVGLNFNYSYLSYVRYDPSSWRRQLTYMCAVAGRNTYTMSRARRTMRCRSSMALLQENHTNNFVRSYPDGSQDIYDLAMPQGSSC